MANKTGYHSQNSELEELRRQQVRAAKELHYGKDVIAALHNAKTENELYRIMTDARQNWKDPEKAGREKGGSITAYFKPEALDMLDDLKKFYKTTNRSDALRKAVEESWKRNVKRRADR